MAFQDFISSKVSEKAAIEAALARVITELNAAIDAAPAVNKVVIDLISLLNILKSSPKAVEDAAKEAIRDACGDVSLLSPNPEVVTLVIPKFVTEAAIPTVSEDIVGELAETATDVVVTAPANEIVTYTTNTTEATNNTETTEETKPKRRTQAGFNRKVEEWSKTLDNLNESNYEALISQVDDQFKFWTDGTKFESEEIKGRLQDAITFWTSQEPKIDSETEETEAVADMVTATEIIEDSLTNSEADKEDLSSFEVPSTESDDVDDVDDVDDDTLESFLNRLNADNLSESGLGDLQEEIRILFGIGNIPQTLVDAILTAWERLDQSKDNEDATEDDSNLEGLVDLVEEINETYSEPQDTVEETLEIYTGYVPEDQELSSDDDDSADQELNNQIVQDNLDWQEAILSCDSLECLNEWEASIKQTVDQVPNSVLPETFEALRTTRDRLEKAEQDKAANTQNQIDNWLSRAEMAFDLQEVQTIYDEIRESGIIPSMELIRTLDAAKVRLTPVAKPEPTLEEAKESISNTWGTSPTTSTTSKTKNKNPFEGKKMQVQRVVAEEVTADTVDKQSDHVSINGINTSGVFTFKTLEGKTEHHTRFDDQYILEPGKKLYEPSTGFVFEVVTWEQAKSMSPLLSEDTNKLPLKSLHSPTRSYPKTARTEDFAIISDSLATQLVENYRKQISQIDNETSMIGS